MSKVNCSSQARRIRYLEQICSIFVTCIMLAACSSNQNEFFAHRNALISQGYTWQRLDSCRPANEDVPSIPLIGFDGRRLVCYTLVPPKNRTAELDAATTPEMTPVLNRTKSSTAKSLDKRSGASGVVWKFSNF